MYDGLLWSVYEGLLWLCMKGYYEALKVESVVVFIIELGIWVVRASGTSTAKVPHFGGGRLQW